MIPRIMTFDEEGKEVEYHLFPHVKKWMEIPGIGMQYDRVLGRGGQSTVVKVRDNKKSYPKVAVVANDGLASLPSLQRRVNLLKRIQHEGIPRHHYCRSYRQMSYVIMDFVPGVPTVAAADYYRLRISDRLKLIMAICRVVSMVHSASLIHCDLKPQNILITPNRHPYLIDFGCVLKISELVPLEHPGTRQYKAPERFDQCDASPALDVYSIGIVMYELLVGFHPYARYLENNSHQTYLIENAMRVSNPESLSSLMYHAPQTLSKRCRARKTWVEDLESRLIGELDAIALKAVSKNPEDRYATVDQLRVAIKSHLKS